MIINRNKIWNLAGLSFESSQGELVICASGILGVGYETNAALGNLWANEKYEFSCPINGQLPSARRGFRIEYMPRLVVPHFSLNTIRHGGEANDAGFTLNNHRYLQGLNDGQAIGFEFEIGALGRESSFIDRVGFSFTAIGSVRELERDESGPF